MRKIKNFFKRHWNKAVALFCALAIATTTTVTSFVYAAIGDKNVEWTDLVRDIAGFVPPIGTVLDFADLCYDVYVYFFVTIPSEDPYEWTTNKEVILAAWKTITDNSPMTEDQFADYWQKCIDELGIADDRLIMIEETVRLGHTLSDVIQYCYHSDGDGVSVSDSGDVQITGKKFKQMVDYWSDYYIPKDNIDQFTYSYQDAANKQGKGNYYRFTPHAPVYVDTAGSSTAWGNHGWSGGAYYLPFLSDDDKGDYYSEKYYHIYSTRDDGTLKICIDTYLLKDNSLADSKSYNWDTARMNVGLAFFDNAYYLQFYKSYFDYKSNTDPYSNIYFSSALSTGLVTSGVSITPQYFLQNLTGYTTFTPDTDTADDYGFIISSSPFELWFNQTEIDTSKIPDDYVITLNGDTFYDYTITNTTGDTTTINKYVTNNYYIPETDKKDDDQGGSSGDVTVSGDVNVKGDIDVSGKVDINVNVSQGSSESAGDYIEPGEIDADLDGYLSHVPDVSKDFIDYLKDFFGWLPKEIYGLLVLGLVVAIFCRLNGR